MRTEAEQYHIDACIERAEQVLLVFQSATGTDDEDAVCDLLANLMHWCDHYKNDFHRELARAQMHYRAEKE